jgi:hypothetical protein
MLRKRGMCIVSKAAVSSSIWRGRPPGGRAQMAHGDTNVASVGEEGSNAWCTQPLSVACALAMIAAARSARSSCHRRRRMMPAILREASLQPPRLRKELAGTPNALRSAATFRETGGVCSNRGANLVERARGNKPNPEAAQAALRVAQANVAAEFSRRSSTGLGYHPSQLRTGPSRSRH